MSRVDGSDAHGFAPGRYRVVGGQTRSGCVRRVVVGEDRIHPVDAIAPQRFELIEQSGGAPDGGGDGAHELFASVLVLLHEVGALEDRDVLLHRGEAHRVVACECRDRDLRDHRPPHDVASRGVGERVERVVDLRGAHQIYNH